ncbi:MAG TPA: hypothetical protein VK152_10510 [Paludibacter sp.]|nr:hypothetical protein [Paludibacter sp.]
MKKAACLLIILAAFGACQPTLDYTISGYTQKIIVEGSIANGEYPSVYLSLNNPLSQKVDSVSILKNVIRTAKVTVSDGVNTEILTSRWDKTHFPPYVYRGYDLKGEEGKTYYLTVEYSGYTLTSQTTIPASTNISTFKTRAVDGNDTLRILSMTFHIDASRKVAYRISTKKSKDKFFRETPVVFNSEFSFSGDKTFDISPKADKNDPTFSEGTYFSAGDTVLVRFSTIDSISTQFFKALTLFSASNGIGNDVFIGEKEALKSNITPPGFGIWWGSGVKNYRIVIK